MPPAFSESRKMDGACVVLLEALHHPVAFRLRHAAMQEEDFPPEGLLQIALQHVAHLGELGENERALAHDE